MAIIIPSILEQTVEDFDSQVKKVFKIPEISCIHVDFCDEDFVDNKTITIEDLSQLSPAIEWEAHIMAKEPDNFLDYKLCGFSSVIIHYEAFNKNKILPALKDIQKAGLKAALAINPQTSVDVFGEYALELHFGLIMGVIPGKQGNPFVEMTFERVRLVKQLFPSLMLEVDGSVNTQTIAQLKSSGADVLNCGSALMHASDIRVAYDELSKLIK